MNSKETKQSSEKELRVPSSLATRETRIKVKWQIKEEKEEIEEVEGKAAQSRRDEKSVTTMDSYLSGSSLHERTIMTGHANLCVARTGRWKKGGGEGHAPKQNTSIFVEGT